jgi:thioredoxin 1
MKTLKSKQEFNSFIAENKGKNIIVDVYADWCGPCKIMTPVFENVALEIGKEDRFVKLDSDILGEELEKQGIRITTIPRFLAISVDSPTQITLLQDMGGTQTKTALVESIKKHLS